MHQTTAIRIKEIVLTPLPAATMHNVAGQIVTISRKICMSNAKHFAQWMADHYHPLFSLDHDGLVAYRAHLAEIFAQTAFSSMWTVARRLLNDAVQRALSVVF